MNMITIKIRHEHERLGFEKENNKINGVATSQSSEEEKTFYWQLNRSHSTNAIANTTSFELQYTEN